MALTLTQLRTNLKAKLRNRITTNATLDTYINDGYFDFTGRINLPELRSTKIYAAIIDPTKTLAYEANMIAILDAHNDTNDIGMKWEPYNLFRERTALVTTSGFLWSTFNRTIHIHPTPEVATVFSVTYQFQPTALSDSNLTPVIHDQFRYGIELLAAVHAWRDLGEPDLSDQIMVQYQEWVAQRQLTNLVERKTNLRRRTIRPKFHMSRPDLGV